MYYATIRAAYVCKLFLEHYWVNPSYGDATLSAAYVCKHYLQNHWIILYIWVFLLKGSLCNVYPHNHLVTVR